MTAKAGDVLRTRAADPSEPGIRGVLLRNLPDAAPADRIAWLYGTNPCGKALVWVAEREGSLEPVATSAAHRRAFRIDGREALALNLSDFAIDVPYRTLGPALGLLRATLAAVAEHGFAMSYDVPSESMLALYRRLGYVELGRMERHVRPLSLAPALARRIGAAAKVLAPPLDLLLRARDAFASTPAGVRVEPLEGAFGAEFDVLEAREASRHRVRGARSAAYLDWRYRRHTMWKHGVLCARRGGDLLGFIVWREAGEVFGIAELVDGGDTGVARALVKALASLGRQRGATALSAETLAGSPSSDRFRDLGFVKRGDGPGPVVYVPPGSPVGPDLLDARHWWFLGGDRDI
ncbi:MAG: GNAT family N-acetyltransferase [Planctomycetes bacterium]|nr:GNAT family N-acetyltransferase [Planctomycetota bacterium]